LKSWQTYLDLFFLRVKLFNSFTIYKRFVIFTFENSLKLDYGVAGKSFLVKGH